MPLNEGAINEILPFAPEGVIAAGDVLALAVYAEHTMRLRGHQPGIAERALQNIANRQSAHIAAGLSQFMANRYVPGVVDDGDLDKVEEAMRFAIQAMIDAAKTEIINEVPEPYIIGEFYTFRHPIVRVGFEPAQGGVIQNAATKYPDAWAYLQTTEGQLLCKTEAQWQAMSTAVEYTLADGTTVGWNGIGGVPFYAPNTATGELKLPDLRGMYPEAAGFDSLDVGGSHLDAQRQLFGEFGLTNLIGIMTNATGCTGPFTTGSAPRSIGITAVTGSAYPVRFDSSRVAPSAAKNQPRAWGALACVYLGAPR